MDRAKEAYEEQMRRALLVWSTSKFNEFVASEGARVYVYLCLKLGRELERCRSVMDALKFYPDVKTLRNGN
jgi:hypothetical protein